MSPRYPRSFFLINYIDELSLSVRKIHNNFIDDSRIKLKLLILPPYKK